MKKLLILVLALAIAMFALTGCDLLDQILDNDFLDQLLGNEQPDTGDNGDNGDNGDTGDNGDNGENNNQGGEPEVEVDEDLQAAYDYIKLTYKTLNSTPKSYEVIKNVPVGEKSFAVTWSVSVDTIEITETEDGKFYTINIPELGAEPVNYTLSFSVENEKGEKKEGSFNLSVPEFKVHSFDDYADAEKGSTLTIQGVVSALITKESGSQIYGVYLQDLENKGGYYLYNLTEAQMTGIEIGVTVEAVGTKDLYNGNYQLKDISSVEIVDSTVKTVTPVDITELYLNASDLKATELTRPNGMLVTIRGVTIKGVQGKYLYFELAGKQTYVYISSSNNPTSTEALNNIKNVHGENYYNQADVTGIIGLYSSELTLYPVSADCFSNIVEIDKTDEFKVAETMKESLPNIVQEDKTVSLVSNGTSFPEVAIAWEFIDAAGVATLDGDKVTFTVPTDGTTKVVKIKATFTLNDITEVKEYNVTVKGYDTITFAEADNKVVDFLNDKYTEEKFYVVGTIVYISNSQYGNMTLKCVDNENYEIDTYGLYDANGKRYDSFTGYKPQVGDTITILTVVGKYNNKTQFKNPVLVSYVLGEGNTDVPDTPPAGDEGETTMVPVKVENPVVGTAYKFALNQETIGKFLYFNGTTTDFLGTSVNYEEGVDVTIKAVAGVDGSYTISFMDGTTEKFVEIYLNDSNKARIRIVDTATNYYTYNEQYNVYVAVFGDKTYYIGTYDTFETFSASGINYITNAGNFIAGFYTMTESSETPDNPPAGDTTDSALSVGTGYNVYVDVESLGGKVYVTGDPASNASYYLATSAEVANAATLYVEAVPGVEGGYYLYFMKGDVKTYIHTYERTPGDAGYGKGSIELITTTPTNYYTYDATYNTLIVTSADGNNKYYVGTYYSANQGKVFDTLSCSNYSYLTADNVGSTQFPMYFVAVEGDNNDDPTLPPEGGDNEEEQTITIADLIKADAEAGTYEVSGTVVATNAKSFLLQDATGMILVYTNSAPTVAAGDVVIVNGTTSQYNNTWQFGNSGLVVTKTGDATVTHPTATVVDGAKLDTYAAPIAPEYVQVTGKLVVSGTYFNLVVDGATKMQGSLTYLADPIKSEATALDGKIIVVTGYTTGVSSSKYVNLMVTDVEEATVTAAEKVAVEKDALSIKTNFSADEDLVLPANGKAYTEVVITWTVNGEAVTGSYAITQTAEVQTLTVVATLTAGEETATKEFTVNVAAISNVTVSELALVFDDKAKRTEFDTSHQVWVDNGVTVTNNKASSTSNVGDYAGPARFYASSSLTITAGDKTITKIVFQCNNKDYATALQNSLASVSGITVTVDSKTVTVEFAEGVTSFNIAKLTAQVRMDSLTVFCF